MKTIIPYKASHPGSLIQDELDAREDMNQKELASLIGVKPSFLNEVIKGKRPITPDLAILLEQTLGISAEYWMRYQSQYDLDIARIKERNINRLKLIEMWDIFKKYIPVGVLSKRNYLSDNLEQNIHTMLALYGVANIEALINLAMTAKETFLYRRSSKLIIDEKNMLAWRSMATFEAHNQACSSFNAEHIHLLSKELNDIFYTNQDVLAKVRVLLNHYGIKFVVVEKLPQTPVDGFTFWSEHNPAIAMSLRHKRLDNFAFTLMHELGHIALHLDKNKNNSFLDWEETSVNHFETEADLFAQSNLIPDATWKEIKQQCLDFNDETIMALSHKYQIHPALIIGRYSYESDRFALKTQINRMLNL